MIIVGVLVLTPFEVRRGELAMTILELPVAAAATAVVVVDGGSVDSDVVDDGCDNEMP